MLKTQIVSGSGNTYKAEVVDGTGEKHALVVATRPLKVFENSVRFFTNDAYGADMNIDASAGGTPEQVHNGTDTSLWTASDIVGGGKTTFDSTDRSHGGTKSIKIDNTAINDIYQLAKGSDLDCNSYVSITMWINVDKDWKAGDSVELYGWDTGTGLQVGTAVKLESYFDYGSFDTWHKITIPLTDMGALASYATLDALRVKQFSKEGKAPKYYLDDIQFEQTGSAVAFTLEPDNGTWLHVNEFTVSFADAMSGTLADGTMPALAYNKVLGETLIAGINYQRIQGDNIQFSQTILNLMGLMSLPGVSICSAGSDGTNTWATFCVKHKEPLILKVEDADKLQWTVAEDLTGLLHFRISAGCSIEQREKKG